MKSNITAADEPGARSASKTGCLAAGTTWGYLVEGFMLLGSKDRAARFRDVLPIDSVEIFLLLVVPRVPPLPSLHPLDIQFGRLPNTRLISAGADYNVLSVNQL